MYFGPVVYVLHVQLDEVEPPIWRRVVVDEATKLPKLSRILEAAMGWDGYHLHHFEIGDGVIFSDPGPRRRLRHRRAEGHGEAGPAA